MIWSFRPAGTPSTSSNVNLIVGPCTEAEMLETLKVLDVQITLESNDARSK